MSLSSRIMRMVYGASPVRRTQRYFLTASLLVLLLPGLVLPWSTSSSATKAVAGTIAYVRADNHDEIRLIEADGTGDRLLWSHGQPDPDSVYAVLSLAWKHDATELAFISNHEKFLCSIFESDIYSIHPDDSGYRRITNAPACHEFANYPKGTVQIEVENQSMYAARFTVYFQGASEFQPVWVETGQIQTVTFTDVADFGPDILQYAVASNDQNLSRRSWGAPVNVQAGNTVKARLLITKNDALLEFGAKQPTWRSDGAKIGYVLALGDVNQIDANPAPAALGESLLSDEAGTIVIKQLAWSPVPAMANQLLYAGRYEESDSSVTGIYRILEGGQGLGEQLVTAESWESVLGLAWLPDGSGFVYAITEDYAENANIC